MFIFNFKGNGHVIYNGSFFYNPENRPKIFRFDIPPNLSHAGPTMRNNQVDLPGLNAHIKNYLYTPDHNFNYVDFDIDENGKYIRKLITPNTYIIFVLKYNYYQLFFIIY